MATKKLRQKEDSIKIMQIGVTASNGTVGLGSDGRMYGWSEKDGFWYELWDTADAKVPADIKPKRGKE